MAYKVLFIFFDIRINGGDKMKDLGLIFKEARLANGVSLLEASEDLKIESSVLENIEEGNVRAFKDMYMLKELIKEYSKYLGLDPNKIVEEFNDFLFCHTSKISTESIKELEKRQETEEKKVISPYTKIPKPKKDFTVLKRVLIVVLAISVVMFTIYTILNRAKTTDHELKGCETYELTY